MKSNYLLFEDNLDVKLGRINPEDRTLENRPKYSNGKSKISIQKWLVLKKSPEYYKGLKDYSWGWSPNGRCYGWSHRAVNSFAAGDKITNDTIGNWKGGNWKIKTNEEAERMAKEFAKNVA